MNYTPAEQAAHRVTLIAALRSGTYAQGFNALRPGLDDFCCLGVACDISGLGEWNDSGAYVTPREHDYYELPSSVRDYYGFADRVGQIGGEVDALSVRNDSGKYDFNAIANAIESGEVNLVEVPA